MNYELLEKLFVCTLLFSTKDYLPFFFSCVTPVDISFYFRILMCDFYLIPWPTCKIICYLFTASCSCTFTLVHQQWDRLVFQFCNIFCLDFHAGALLFSKMSKVRSETVSTEKWKVYLSQDQSSCGLHLFILLTLCKI